MPILDLYLSHNPERLRWGVGLAAHELCHLISGAVDMYGVCGQISAGYYNVMDTSLQGDPSRSIREDEERDGAADRRQSDRPIHDDADFAVGRAALPHSAAAQQRPCRREYFLIENRFPGTPPLTNYDGPLETGAVVVWQIFEDRNIVNWSDVCQGDPRFIRRRAVLTDPQQSFELAWGDGSPAGFRISAPKPNAGAGGGAHREDRACTSADCGHEHDGGEGAQDRQGPLETRKAR